MKKARGKISHVSVPLKREAPTTMTVSSELKLINTDTSSSPVGFLYWENTIQEETEHLLNITDDQCF